MNDGSPMIPVTPDAIAQIAEQLEAWAAARPEQEQALLAWMVERAMAAATDDATGHIIIVGGAPVGLRIGQVVERYRSGSLAETSFSHNALQQHFNGPR